MKYKLLIIGAVAFTMSFSPLYASGQDTSASAKPKIEKVQATTLEATVEAVDYEKRMLTLKGPKGDSVTIEAGEHVRNLAQVKVGDLLTIDYIEAVTIQAFAPGEIESGAVAIAAAGRAKLGQKPAGVAVKEVSVVTTIEAIDLENQMVTLKGASGASKTVKARNPENLKKVEVGDKVMITYTEAIAVNVAAKPAEK